MQLLLPLVRRDPMLLAVCYKFIGFLLKRVNSEKIAGQLEVLVAQIITEHAEIGHSNEVLWTLFASRNWGINLANELMVTLAERSNDPLVLSYLLFILHGKLGIY